MAAQLRGARRVVGREAELARLADLITGAALAVITGPPGMGKTALWEAGVAVAAERGALVLSARPVDGETGLSFAGLTDLLDGVDSQVWSSAGPPAAAALDAALLRAQPTGPRPEPRMIGTGLLAALRALSSRQPVLVAIDDVVCLDAATVQVLSFAARRLRDEPVHLLLTRRAKRSALERAIGSVLEPGSTEQVALGPLSIGAIRRLLYDRLGLALPGRDLRRLAEIAAGNPLVALEVGRALADSDSLPVTADLPVPDLVRGLARARVGALAPATRRALLAAALQPDLSRSDLAAVAAPTSLAAAVEADLVTVDGDRVRIAHPLLVSAVRHASSAADRRRMHADLARVARDAESRVHHLVLAAAGTDAGLAAEIADVAARAAARGATDRAVELAGHALRLTPADSVERPERLLNLAEHLLVAGEPDRVARLVRPELPGLPPGALRGRAHLLLFDSSDVPDVATALGHLDAALGELNGMPELRAQALARKAECTLLTSVQDIELAEQWATQAVRAVRRVRGDARAEHVALHAVAWARVLLGRPVHGLHAQAIAASEQALPIADSVDRVAAVRLVWRGEIAVAREAMTRLLAIADDRGEAVSWALMRLHLTELELRAGEWDRAEELLDEWEHSFERSVLTAPGYERCRALLAAGRGSVAEAEKWAAAATDGARRTGVRWELLELSRARGITALLDGEPEAAVGLLGEVWEHTLREHVAEPGAFPVAADLVEAFVAIGDRERAEEVTARLATSAAGGNHPWAAAGAARGRALTTLAGPAYDEQAAADLAAAADDYGRLGLRFDRARALLALGRAARRHKKWGAARSALEAAADAFAGSPGWLDAVREELSRIGGRRVSSEGGLSPAEQRVARLAAEGLPNKVIARRLSVSVSTVEVHLSAAYAKLGIRSRSQLSGRLPRPRAEVGTAPPAPGPLLHS